MLEKDVRDFFFKTKENYNLVAGQKELYIDGLRIDIFAVDKQGNPFIIEFKKDKNRHIVGQSAHYLALIPAKHQDIEKKLNFFNINWDNLKVLCIAKSFNQRDFDALNFEPIKDRVFLYKYNIIKDYREKSIFGLDLIYTDENGKSPLFIPPKPENRLDFAEHFKKILIMEGKENKRQYYTNTVLPLLNEVAEGLRVKYANIKLYPHISYFQSGPHVLFRLGLDEGKSHRAAIAVSFLGENIECGFDLTHSLEDAKELKKIHGGNPFKIVNELLDKKDYFIWLPNSGIKCEVAIADLEEKGLRLLLDSYNPQIMKDCYFSVTRLYEETVLTTADLLTLFDEEYLKFKPLITDLINSR